MTGQDAVNSSQDFHQRRGAYGRGADEDGWRCARRGGAVDPAREGQPIKFIGTGEKPEAFEPFIRTGLRGAFSGWAT